MTTYQKEQTGSKNDMIPHGSSLQQNWTSPFNKKSDYL
jgi:hypothetical protein